MPDIHAGDGVTVSSQLIPAGPYSISRMFPLITWLTLWTWEVCAHPRNTSFLTVQILHSLNTFCAFMPNLQLILPYLTLIMFLQVCSYMVNHACNKFVFPWGFPTVFHWAVLSWIYSGLQKPAVYTLIHAKCYCMQESSKDCGMSVRGSIAKKPVKVILTSGIKTDGYIFTNRVGYRYSIPLRYWWK